MEEKVFALKFVVKDGNIATKVRSKNISPHESIGLLEIAKQQLLDSLKRNKKEFFDEADHE